MHLWLTRSGSATDGARLGPGTVKNVIRHYFDNETAYDSRLVSARVAELEDKLYLSHLRG